MDELFDWLILFGTIGGIGWLLGIIGFFRAHAAARELRGLRQVVAGLLAGRDGAAPVVGAAAPVGPAVGPAAAQPAVSLPGVTMGVTAGEVPAGADGLVGDLPPPDAPPPDAPPPVVPPGRPRRDWEELLTAKWGVWLGAGALMMSGVFLVRYAADQGMLGPGTRCAAAAVLGCALIAGAEWLLRRSTMRGGASVVDVAADDASAVDPSVVDAAADGRPVVHPPVVQAPVAGGPVDYVPGALAAGGVAVLFAAAYMAGPLYALVPAPVAFALLALAGLSGLALSLRMGQLVAAVGLVGAFVTPLLVATDAPSLPGLFVYLLVVAAASLAVVRHTAWVWLGWATTIACAGFVAAIAVVSPDAEAWAPALFVPATMVLVLGLLPSAALDHVVGRRLAIVPLAALGGAGLLLALTAPGTATRAGVLLLAPVVLGKAAREPRLDRLPWLAALLFLLLIASWGLPAWTPTGEAVFAGGDTIAVLPGAWLPAALSPLLLTAAGMAALFAAAGLWGERRRPSPLRWAALTAAVPVLTLAVLYARVRAFQPDDLWAGAAVGLAALSTLAAGAAAREGGVGRAGVHAAGATAALALGCGAVLSGQWLTVALSLFLPALAEIEYRADLPPLRRVALAVAGVAVVRLFLNPEVLDYADGQWPVLNGLLVAYGGAAVAFAVAARLFRRGTPDRGGDDLVVAVLELGSAAFVAGLALLEVRQWSTGGRVAAAEGSFREAAMDVAALSLLALFARRLERRSGRRMVGLAARIGGGLALVGGVLLVLANPAFFDDGSVGGGLLVNALLPAYLVPGAAALAAVRSFGAGERSRRVLLGYGLVAGFAYVTLAVRHAFHPDGMGLDAAPIEDAELWAWSGAWLLFGGALMAFGVVRRQKGLRLAALAIVGLTGAKVFLIDMAGLVGLWRVLSFLGLGLVLIGLGAVYRRFVAVDRRAGDAGF